MGSPGWLLCITLMWVPMTGPSRTVFLNLTSRIIPNRNSSGVSLEGKSTITTRMENVIDRAINQHLSDYRYGGGEIMKRILAAILLVLSPYVAVAQTAPIQVFASNGVKAAIEALKPGVERAAG